MPIEPGKEISALKVIWICSKFWLNFTSITASVQVVHQSENKWLSEEWS